MHNVDDPMKQYLISTYIEGQPMRVEAVDGTVALNFPTRKLPALTASQLARFRSSNF